MYESFGESAVQPFADGCCAELAALLNHHLQRVGQLDFAAGADVVVHQVLERFPELLDVLDVVDADDGLVAHEFLRLFDQALDAAFGIGHGDPETARVFYFVRVKDVLACVREALNVGLEQGVPEDDEQRFVVAHVGEREAYRLAEPLRVALEYGAGLAPFGLARQVAVHGFGLVAGDEDGLGGGEWPGVVHNPVDDDLSADGQQALGQVVGVGAHALALAGNGQNDLHMYSFLLRGKCRKMLLAMRRAATPNRLRRPSQGGEFFLLRVARWVGVDAGRKMGGWGRAFTKNVKGLKTGLNAEACGLFG